MRKGFVKPERRARQLCASCGYANDSALGALCTSCEGCGDYSHFTVDQLRRKAMSVLHTQAERNVFILELARRARRLETLRADMAALDQPPSAR